MLDDFFGMPDEVITNNSAENIKIAIITNDPFKDLSKEKYIDYFDTLKKINKNMGTFIIDDPYTNKELSEEDKEKIKNWLEILVKNPNIVRYSSYTSHGKDK